MDDIETMQRSKILIIGVGGLGCTTSSLLARHGFDLVLIDGDVIEKSNLDRQILFFNEDVGKPKVDVAYDKLSEFSKIEKIFDNFNDETISKYNELFSNVELIIDCTDNVETRKLINNFSFDKQIPWIYSAGVQNIGSVYFVDPSKRERACYDCFNEDKYGESACEVGVLNTTVSIVGALAARIATSYLETGNYPDDLIRLKDNQIYTLKLKRNEECNH